VSTRRIRRGAHAARRRGERPVRCVVVTVSDTRQPRTDRSGARAEELLHAAGHEVVERRWVRDEIAPIRRELRRALRVPATDLVLLTGGTGVSPRDVTPQAIEPMLDVALPGFGERFRERSIRQVGTAAWLSRAGAGVAAGRLVAYLPGSPGAVELGLREVLIPELTHALRLLGRIGAGD